MQTALEAALVTAIPVTNNTHVTRVTIGKWANDPKEITLSIYPDHPLSPEERGDRAAGIARAQLRQPNRAYVLPMETIGGSHFDTIEGTVQIRLLKDVTPESGVTILETIKARIRKVIRETANLRNFYDEFDVHLWALDPSEAWGYASGGDDVSVLAHWCDWVARTSVRRTY